jgi:hypothetical protein
MMTPEDLERERRKSAEDLARVTEAAHGVDVVRTQESVLGPREAVRTTEGDPPPVIAEPEWNPPAPPDLGPVNASYETSRDRSSRSLLSLFGADAKQHRAQARFNSDQVQLDNALVTWTAGHFAATHQHYDASIDRMQKRMDEIDTRHRELERELVRHVHEMARRIDVVLGEGEKGRVSHEAALRSIRERLRVLEERLR